MAGFPSPNLGTPAYSGGVPQWFTKSGDPSSWFPGAPQYNMSMQDLMSNFGSLDPQFQDLMAQMTKYGDLEQRGVMAGGKAATTGAVDKLAAGYDPTGQAAREIMGGLRQGGDTMDQMVKYASDIMPAQAGTMAGAYREAGQVPGQIAQMQQAAQNAYKMNQINSMQQLISLIGNAAGAQYGYEGTQLGADRGQMALSEAQNREQLNNMNSLISMIFGNQMPSLFGGGQNALLSGGGLNPQFGGGFMGALRGGAGAAGAGFSAADFGTSLESAAPFAFA